jgi:hypothetical protein
MALSPRLRTYSLLSFSTLIRISHPFLACLLISQSAKLTTSPLQDIYQRSVGLEGSSGGALDFSKKKLPWFQKEK